MRKKMSFDDNSKEYYIDQMESLINNYVRNSEILYNNIQNFHNEANRTKKLGLRRAAESNWKKEQNGKKLFDNLLAQIADLRWQKMDLELVPEVITPVHGKKISQFLGDQKRHKIRMEQDILRAGIRMAEYDEIQGDLTTQDDDNPEFSAWFNDVAPATQEPPWGIGSTLPVTTLSDEDTTTIITNEDKEKLKEETR